MRYLVVPLGEHELGGFRCGNPVLDDWLAHHGRSSAGRGVRTYLLVESKAGVGEAGEVGEVRGYFAIAPHLLQRTEAPGSVARGAPRQIPAVLLAKLALASDLHGKGLGSELLVQALRVIIEAARVAGGRVVVVDAIDEQAVAFYRRHDFVPVRTEPGRLVMKLSTAARALGLDWP